MSKNASSSAVAFVMKKEHSFVWPVVVRVPADGGEIQEMRFTARFKVIGKKRQDEVFAELQKPPAERKAAGDMDIEAAFIREVLVDFPDDMKDGEGKVLCAALRDETGERVKFGAESRDALIDVLYTKSAIIAAWQQAMRGERAKLKNS